MSHIYHLLIEQRGPQGLIKTWRLKPQQGSLTFGNSKFADLQTPIDSVKGIQGVFEFRDGSWKYINLDVNTQHSQLSDGAVELSIPSPTEIGMGTSKLILTPYEAKIDVLSSLEKSDLFAQKPKTYPYQLFTVQNKGQLLESGVVSIGTVFKSTFDKSRKGILAKTAADWISEDIGGITVSQRTIYLESLQQISSLSTKGMIDDSSKKALIGTLLGIFLLVMIIVTNSGTGSVQSVLKTQPVVLREVDLTPPKKRQVQKAPAPKPVQREVAAADPTQKEAAPSQTEGGSSKAASAIKSLGQGRISQLVGKISAASAKSQNIVVSSGVAAGTQPTGRSLAAVGTIDRSGKDWAAEGKGVGLKISTSGRAGGQGTAGLGGIAAGNTGSGGVGLLEEEGEIEGGLDRDIIAQYIRSRLGEILYCYERQLSASPDLYGKVAVRFTISGSGAVETQKIGDTTLKNSMVEGCILQKVATWKFPEPKGNTKVLVTYPFLFSSRN